jgi:DNA polymerase I-like protein with 3'-5' exonuclease and polymerase domains
MTTQIPDYISLEMQLAKLMSQQEASGFRFDMDAATRVRASLQQEFDELTKTICSVYQYVPGKVFTPKRADKKKGYVAGAPMTKLTDFNPTSRQHIAWALQTFRGARFTKVTDTGKPKVDEATISEIRDNALSLDNQLLHDECQMFIRLLTLQKWLGQLSEGTNSWFNSIEGDGCIHHSCTLATQTGRNAHRGPNLGQVVSAPWARELFIPHPGMVMVGADLESLELRCLGHYLQPWDEGSFADVVINGDIHQQNADRVGCTRKEVKTITYAFIYGAGDQKLGHSLHPELSDAQKKQLGQELRRKFLDAIPGLEPLIDAVKERIRSSGRLRALDGRPVFCTAEHASLNYLLQSAGAILSKRYVVIGQQLLDEAGLTYDVDYTRCAYVHDEVQLSVVPSEVDRVKHLLEAAAPKAGQYYKFRVPITAAADSGDNWAATH